MKTMFLKACALLALLLYVSNAEAQISKGMKMINGSANFSSTNGRQVDSLYAGEGRFRNIGFSPAFGYFLTDKFCIGLGARVQNNKQIFESSYTINNSYNTSESNTFSYGFNPYARYYMAFSEKFYGFFNASAGVNISKSKSENYYDNPSIGSPSDFETISKGYFYNGGVSFGLTYFVSPKVALETSLAGINYSNQYSKRNVNSIAYNKTSGFTAGILPNGINLAVSFYLK